MANTIELRTLGAVIKETYEDNPDTNAYTDAEKAKLAGIEGNATRNRSDSDLMDRSNHTGFQAIGTISGLSDAMDAKVDKVAGKELSDNNFTNDEKTKLSGLEGPHFKGTYPSLAALQAAGIEAVAGDYADVDGGAGQETFRCIWDVTNEEWVPQLGESTDVTGAQVKSLYESQPDTNAFTDAEKAKLSGIATEATKNSTDAALLNRGNHTGTQAISTITGLQTALDGKISVDGEKLLSDNNYTTAEKDKLAAITALTGSTNFTWRFRGAWNPNTNNPNLQNGTGTPGDFFSVSANGTRSFGNQTFNFIEGDLVFYSGGVWRRIAVNPVNYKPRGGISPAIPALRCVTTSNSIPRVTETVVTSWSAQYDQFSILNAATGAISIPSWATHARVSVNISYSGSNADSARFGTYIRRGSTIITATVNESRGISGPGNMVCTGIIPVTSSDVFTISVWHNFVEETRSLGTGWTWLNVELFESI